jgi:hypothetical protein
MKAEDDVPPREVKIVAKGTLHVAVPIEPSAPLTEKQVQRTLRALRERIKPRTS